MRLKPRQWTHHHTMRLYHISRLATFSFIIFILLYGLLAASLQVKADQISSTAPDVTVSATVPGASEGPTVAENTSSGGGPAPIASSTAAGKIITPSVTVQASGLHVSKQTFTISGKNRVLDSFDYQYPEFSGHTNIPQAIIFLQIPTGITIRGTAYADQNGDWHWWSPEPIAKGLRTITVKAQNETLVSLQASASLDFYVNTITALSPSAPVQGPVPAGGNLFDILVQIPPQFKSIAPGDDLVAGIKLINFGSPGHAIDVTVVYVIENEHGAKILETSQTVAVATQLSILKTFTLNPGLANGSYKLIVRVPSKDVIATAEDSFELKGTGVIPVGENGKINFTIIFQGLLALLFLFVLIAYFEYNKVSVLGRLIKKADERDLRAYNN